MNVRMYNEPIFNYEGYTLPDVIEHNRTWFTELNGKPVTKDLRLTLNNKVKSIARILYSGPHLVENYKNAICYVLCARDDAQCLAYVPYWKTKGKLFAVSSTDLEIIKKFE